jgi:hypothetical protein
MDGVHLFVAKQFLKRGALLFDRVAVPDFNHHLAIAKVLER